MGLRGGGQKPRFWLQDRPQVGALDEEPTYDPAILPNGIVHLMCNRFFFGGGGGFKNQGFGFRVDLK